MDANEREYAQFHVEGTVLVGRLAAFHADLKMHAEGKSVATCDGTLSNYTIF